MGDYDRCAFISDGMVPSARWPVAVPRHGRCDRPWPSADRDGCRGGARAGGAALLKVHPYETRLRRDRAGRRPNGRTRGSAGLVTVTVSGLGHRLAAVPATAGGVRIGGDLDHRARTGRGPAGPVTTCWRQPTPLGADVYVTSDLRHHRAAKRSPGRTRRL